MAATTRQKAQKPKAKKIVSDIVESTSPAESFPQTTSAPTYPPYQEPRSGLNFSKVALWALSVLLVMTAYWFFTNTWPVVAMVGGKIVFRTDVDKALYSQYAPRVIDGLVTQKQIEAALESKGVMASDADVDAKIEDLKTKMPQGMSFEEELTRQGMKMDDLRNLLALQLRLEKTVEAQATVSAEDVTAFVKENDKFLTGSAEEKKSQATEQLKQQKQNDLIDVFVTDAKKSFPASWWPSYNPNTPTPAALPVPSDSPEPTK